MNKFDYMLEANKITHEILERCKQTILARETISKEEVSILADCCMANYSVKPAFKGVGGFPGNMCICVNDEIIHGIPNEAKIVKDDIVSLDFGVIYEGYCSDAAISFINNKSSNKTISLEKRLVNKTKQALDEAVCTLKATFPHCKASDIAKTIEAYGNSYGIVENYGGHGIGKELHERNIFIPNTLNYFNYREDINLKIGDFFTIEPMFTMGSNKVKIAEDGFTVKTADGSMSAHFEYSIAITEDGIIILK